MKDIDFDELDRAVSSLMGAVPKDEPKTDDATSSDIPPADTAVSSDSPEPAASNPQSDAPAASKRGRYMDMVRPSAKSIHKTVRPSRVSRQAPSLEPTAVSSPKEDTPEQPRRSVALMRSSSSNTAPPEPAPPATSNDEDIRPLTSPFLPDAKVEKRPLGRPASAPSSSEEAPDTEEQAEEPIEEPAKEGLVGFSEDVDAQLPEQPLPAELDSELLSIETGNEYPLPGTEAKKEPAPEPTPAPEDAPSQTSSEEPAIEPVRTPTVTSIPQQYKVKQTKVDDAPSGTIYDAEPLVHVPEKMPAWMTIIGIIGIILLGVAFGVAVYYFGLI